MGKNEQIVKKNGQKLAFLEEKCRFWDPTCPGSFPPKICYVSFTSISTCSGKKKSAINLDGKLSPKDAAPVELEPSQREQDASAAAIDGSREGRFLLYWITTTSISTSTSFTTTYSVSSALCTAPGSNLCG